MEMTRTQIAQELTELFEDTAEYFCDDKMSSLVKNCGPC